MTCNLACHLIFFCFFLFSVPCNSVTADIWLALVCFLKKTIIFNFDCNLFKTQISHEHGVVWGYAKKKAICHLGINSVGHQVSISSRPLSCCHGNSDDKNFDPFMKDRQTDTQSEEACAGYSFVRQEQWRGQGAGSVRCVSRRRGSSSPSESKESRFILFVCLQCITTV